MYALSRSEMFRPLWMASVILGPCVLATRSVLADFESQGVSRGSSILRVFLSRVILSDILRVSFLFIDVLIAAHSSGPSVPPTSSKEPRDGPARIEQTDGPLGFSSGSRGGKRSLWPNPSTQRPRGCAATGPRIAHPQHRIYP